MSAQIFYLPPEIPPIAGDPAAPYLDALQRIRIVMRPPWATEEHVARSVTITPRLQTVSAPGAVDGFRFSMTVDEAEGLDRRLFVYLAGPVLPGGDREARFHRVASPSDLASVPADEPGAADNPAWLRLDALTLDFPGRIEAMETHDAVISDVARLLKSLAYMDKLEVGTPITISVGD